MYRCAVGKGGATLDGRTVVFLTTVLVLDCNVLEGVWGSSEAVALVERFWGAATAETTGAASTLLSFVASASSPCSDVLRVSIPSLAASLSSEKYC